MYKALFLSPMIPSFEIRETAVFFEEVLCFSSVMNTEDYAIFQKDGLTIHILKAGQDIGEMEFYLEVDNLEEIWEAAKDKTKGLKVKEPFNQKYGMREMHIVIPQTKTLLFIGQGLKS